MNKKIPLRFILEIVGGISIIFGIYWSVQSQRHQDSWQRKIETIHVLESRDRSHMTYINKKTKAIKNKDSLFKISIQDTLLNQKLKKQFVFYENVSIGANVGVYDPEIIERFIGTSFVDFYKRFEFYITYVRKKNNNPDLYIEYEICVDKIIQIKDKNKRTQNFVTNQF